MKDLTNEVGVRGVEIALLSVAPENPRNAETVDQSLVHVLADNIEEIGLIHPLIAYEDDGLFYVTAGGRRLRALQYLLVNDRLAPVLAETIPVRVMDKDEAIAIGQTEQVSSIALSDSDVLHMLSSARFNDLDAAKIGRLLGKSTQFVRQRMAILDLPEAVTEAVHSGRLSLDVAAGLVYHRDDEGLDALVQSVLAHPSGYTFNNLKHMAERERMDFDKHRLADYITREEYLGCGGRLQEDLFGDGAFVLDPMLYESLAKENFVKHVTEKYPGYGQYEVVDDFKLVKIAPGKVNMTLEEEDEWEEIEFTYHDPDDVRELIEEGGDEDDIAFAKRWLELCEKAEPEYADDLKALLSVGIMFRDYGQPAVYANMIPINEVAYGKYCASDYGPTMPDPDTDEGEGFDEDLEKNVPETEKPMTNAMVDRIRRIRLHCARMHLVRDENAVLAGFHAYLDQNHRSGWGFSLSPSYDTFLEDSDPDGKASPAWEKAEAADTKTPANVRKKLARELLMRMNTTPDYKVEPQHLRDYVEIDANFFKGYRKGHLVQMYVDVLKVDYDPSNSKVQDLADKLAEAFHDKKDWLPIGF